MLRTNNPKTKRILALIGVSLGLSIGGIAYSTISTALASIGHDLGASITELQWIMNIFGISICSSLVIAGRIADMYGRKRLYLLGIFGMMVSMLCSGFAQNIVWIFIGQILFGLSAAIILPVSQVLLCNAVPKEDRGKAIGLWAGISGVALAIGPLLSGFVITALSWRWVFLINTPVSIFSVIFTVLGGLGLAIAVVVVNSQSNFVAGYQHGMWLLFYISMIGLVLAISMKKALPVEGSLSTKEVTL